MDAAAAERALDQVLPHPFGAIVVTVLVPAFLYLVGVRFQWRRDGREDSRTAGELMAKLTKMQSDELMRLAEEIKALLQQVELLSAGRYRLQSMMETFRDEIIAARVLIHDYERRLGLPETRFPPLPLPTFAAPSEPIKTLSAG